MTVDLRAASLGVEARAEDPAARSRDLRDASRRFDEALIAARREGRGATATPGRPGVTALSHRGLRPPARVERREDRRVGPGSPAVALAFGMASPAGRVAPSPAAAALRAAVRALPPVIEAARLRDGARLTLALGGALGVDLRGGAAGVEVTLRPAAALERAAAAELPALVAALRTRGVRVARAELAPGAARQPGAPGRQPR